MSRFYAVQFENVSVSLAQDLWDIVPATDKPILLHGFTLSNVGGTADAGDAQEELLRLQIIRGLATVGSGGSSAAASTNISPLNPGDPASSFTARINDTTVAVVGAGTTVNLFADGWNVRIPYQMFFTPECRLACSATQTRMVIRLVGAPADAIAVSGTAFIEELG